MGVFTHCSTDRKSRFSDGTYGVWYAGDCFEVALAETIYHHERFIRRTNEAPVDSQFRELRARVGAKLRGLRKRGSTQYLAPDDYAASQAVAKDFRNAARMGSYIPASAGLKAKLSLSSGRIACSCL